MAKLRILVQWAGHSDLRAMVSSIPVSKRAEILKKIGGKPADKGDLGPIKTLIQNEQFDEIHILSNYPASWNKMFQSWLGQKCKIAKVTLKNPSDYAAIIGIAQKQLGEILKRHDGHETELCLHLSPGTPAMSSIWILLGSTQFPATFFETYQGKSFVTTLPFRLTLDVISEIMDGMQANLERLIADNPQLVEGFEDIIGNSTALRGVIGRAKRAAVQNVSVLLLGESGTGKEMFAQAIQKASTRREGPFVAINCAAFSPSLLESELFGHVKGAFTGAAKDRKGAFEQADGGTLFLDEIGECDLDTQSKLLRTLQPIAGEGPSIRRIRRVGDEAEKTIDVRIIAATNRDPYEAIQQGRFREDLLYRLAQVTIRLPPLRERKSDIPRIAERLLSQINAQFGQGPGYSNKTLSGSAKTFVKSHDWPGNVRQLYNTLIQAAILADHEDLGRQDLEAALGELPEIRTQPQNLLELPLGDGFDLDELLKDIQGNYLRRAMEAAHGNKSEASRLLGIQHYQTLDARLKSFGIEWEKS